MGRGTWVSWLPVVAYFPEFCTCSLMEWGLRWAEVGLEGRERKGGGAAEWSVVQLVSQSQCFSPGRPISTCNAPVFRRYKFNSVFHQEFHHMFPSWRPMSAMYHTVSESRAFHVISRGEVSCSGGKVENSGILHSGNSSLFFSYECSNSFCDRRKTENNVRETYSKNAKSYLAVFLFVCF